MSIVKEALQDEHCHAGPGLLTHLLQQQKPKKLMVALLKPMLSGMSIVKGAQTTST